MPDYRSPLLDWPGAVAADGPDAGVAWHYGDPLREQRAADSGAGLLDQSHRDVLIVPGPDRLGWLHTISSQHLSDLADGDSTQALVLSPNGHVEQHWRVTELDGQVWLDTEPGAGADVLAYLLKMRFLSQVEPAVVTADFAVVSVLGPQAGRVLDDAGLPVPADRALRLPGGGFTRRRPAAGGSGAGPADGTGDFDLIVARPELEPIARRLVDAGAAPVGAWAGEALRAQRREPRLGVDTDHRTLPHEAGWIGSAVHLDKGCYRGQETVARVQNLGKPPRRLVLLHLSGDSEQLPAPGSPVERDGRAVGFVGTAAQHHELGPIALAIVKRTVSGDDPLTVPGHSAAIDPDDAHAAVQEGFAGHRAASPAADGR